MSDAAEGTPGGDRSAGDTNLTPVLGANLRRIRTKRGLSLERLAAESGVSRAMLSQIELGHSTPTINLLWKVATALDVPFSALISARDRTGFAVLRSGDAKVLTSREGKFTSRALFPFDSRAAVRVLRAPPVRALGGAGASRTHRARSRTSS